MSEFATPADGVSLLVVEPERLAALEAQVIDASGRQRVVPAAIYAQYDAPTISALCVKRGIYGLITTELVDFIRDQINHRTAIEIGSGDGVLADALGIIGTDSHQMERPEIRRAYEEMRQPVTKYGPRVRRIDGEAAVKKYRPQVIVASWLTHKWKQEDDILGGNMYAPDELVLLASCELLIFYGNSSAHKNNRLLLRHHVHVENEWMYSRAWRGKNFLGVWLGGCAQL